MLYNLNKVETITGCDEIIANAQREKEQIQIYVARLITSLETTDDSLELAESDLESLDAQITAKTAQIAAMADGKEKEKQIGQLISLQLRRQRVVIRLSDDIATIDANRQIDLATYQARIATLDEAIVALEARKVVIQNAA